MGDRMLYVEQAQGFYQMTSCNSRDGNPNYVGRVDAPADIEGLWTYVYYSHSRDLSRSVGFMQFGTEEAKRV